MLDPAFLIILVALAREAPLQEMLLVVTAGAEVSRLGTRSRSTHRLRPQSNAKLGNSIGGRAIAPKTKLPNLAAEHSYPLLAGRCRQMRNPNQLLTESDYQSNKDRTE